MSQQGLISSVQREKLFRQCKHMLGAPIRGVDGYRFGDIYF